jgi:hypothetical protein
VDQYTGPSRSSARSPIKPRSITGSAVYCSRPHPGLMIGQKSVALPVAQALPPAVGPGWTSLDCSTGLDDLRAQQKPTSFPAGLDWFRLRWTSLDGYIRSSLIRLKIDAT